MGIIKHIIKKIALKLPLRDIFLFESRPDFSDNTLSVFNEMLRRKINKKVKLVWLLSGDTTIKPKKNKCVKYLNINKHRVLFRYFLYSSKVIICCNRFIGKKKKGQLTFYLMHGSPIKNTASFYSCPNYIDWMIVSSEGMKAPSAKTLRISETKCIALGFPRNDALTAKKNDLHQLFGDFKKIIAWYPTVRQYKNSEFCLTNMKAISFLDSKENLHNLDEFLRKNNIVLVIKIHFAQVENILLNENLENIKLINDSFLEKNCISSYSFLACVDALLTDYSSVYYDFLLCNKPVGFIWEDIEIFKKSLGFVDGYETFTRGGEKIYTFSELLSFISRIGSGIDLLQTERLHNCQLVNYSNDGLNSVRVCDFILEKYDAIKNKA